MQKKNQSASYQIQSPQTQYQPANQAQNYEYVSQFIQNNSNDKILQSHFINMSQEQNPQQPVIDSTQTCQQCCFGMCCLCCLFVINNFFSITFGVLFYMFQGEPEKYNYCTNESFRKWSLTVSIILFINCGISILKAFEKYVLKQENLSDFLDFCMIIAFVICIIGLTANISSDCGQLYLLAFIFCTFFYILLGLLICIALIIYMVKSSR
ncbi:transmembrane protein, putative (macronuclear) [Tetrahymena thermophila SB210]|uniref:Transmembrane protein, putative n=1 Tax=Tetrahymena thermophila (strain SB210) TaxID=312017 RepID=W7XF97_TETTS|nr:transmembrane protein, putative [Tetrahymena thermophila SB210]EWS71444.1 transmembrane protein, putative [Tetrahymena thermophila SB210]|eukprot:XP_012656010.1 transmembrane protein, putative [Tetrahymena thermophila SB210]